MTRTITANEADVVQVRWVYPDGQTWVQEIRCTMKLTEWAADVDPGTDPEPESPPE